MAVSGVVAAWSAVTSSASTSREAAAAAEDAVLLTAGVALTVGPSARWLVLEAMMDAAVTGRLFEAAAADEDAPDSPSSLLSPSGLLNVPKALNMPGQSAPLFELMALLLAELCAVRGRLAGSWPSSRARMPAATTEGRSAELRFNFRTNSGSKLSDSGAAFGSSGPSPAIRFTRSSSACFFSIQFLMRSTAIECRRRWPERSRMASRLVVFLPLFACFRRRAPKPPLPPSNLKRTRTTHN
mmetsp:Transcript_39961/g.70301  ORF Transcript_39961/g.70301 Transcript_39961/m.70301 type:complete len:241 (-) Transcript_39961:128-850(-)